jgi:Tol biopolymer transport system component
VSPLGGAVTRLTDLWARGPLAWSTDNRYIVAGRWDDASHGLFAIAVPKGTSHAITQQNPPAADRAPGFSPDGRHLAFARCTDLAAGVCSINVLDVDAHLAPVSAPRLVQPSTKNIGGLAWTRDGKWIVYDTSYLLDARYLWRIKADGSSTSAERIELAGAFAADLATSQNTDRLAFSRYVADFDVFRFSGSGESKAVVQSSFVDIEPQYSPDGLHIAFASARSGVGVDIWRVEADGSEPVQLTHGEGLLRGSPQWSPDGSHIAFQAQSDEGLWHVWTGEAAGGGLRQITAGTNNQHGQTWSHDGRWLYFSADERGKPYVSDLWRVRVEGGTPTRVTTTGSGLSGFEVNAGRGVVNQASDEDSALLLLSIDGRDTQVTKLADCVATRAFTVQGGTVYYVPCDDSPDATLRQLDVTTRRDSVVGTLKQFVRGPISASIRDRSVLYTVSSAERADVMIIEHFR